MTISTVKLSPLGALLFSLFAAPIGSAQDLLQCDLDSGMPGGNLPWTAVDLIDPNLSFTGWDVGPGITVDPNTAGSLGYSINGGAQDSTLVEALADGEYLTCTISPTSGSLDLGGLQVQMSNKRIDFHSARTFALFSSVDGFSEGQELFISPTANKGDLWTHSSSFIFPLAGYGNLSSPVEFRVYPFHVQYGGHKAGLADFDVVDPGPVAPISILTTGKGAVVANPAGSLLVVGSSIQVHAHADPGHRLDGWSGDLTGPGQVRTHVVLGPTVITANFSEATMPQTKLGTNLSGVVGWSTAWNFVDVWKMARPWIVAEVGSGLWESPFGSELQVDARGWPLQIPFTASDGTSQYVHTIMPTPDAGLHQVTIEGTGSVRFSHPVSGPVIQATGGTTTFTVDVPASTAKWLYLDLVSSDPADPVRNIEIVRPGFGASYKTQPFHPLFLQRLGRYSNLRFMDWGVTNNATISSWSQRTAKDAFSQANGGGVAPEYMVELANTLQQDPWFCIPHLADDNYVRELARLVRDSLNPGLVAYVEYSNEVWNTQFDQYHYAEAQGILLGLDSNPNYASHKFYAQRSAEIWAIWEQEFVDDDRIYKVLAAHAAGSFSTGIRATALTDPVINPGGVLADGIAIAPYFGHVYSGFAPGQSWPTIDEILTVDAPATIATVRANVQASKAIADAEGYELIAYEAGQHYVGAGALGNDPLFTALMLEVNRDPRMYDLYLEYLDMLRSSGIALVDNFSSCHPWSKSGSWGVLEFQDQPLAVAHKFRALEEWEPLTLETSSPGISISSGTSVNFSLSGGLGHRTDIYVLACGISGSFPGTTLPSGPVLPLNVDGITMLILNHIGAPSYLGFLGSLDALGDSTATLTAVSGLPPSLVGLDLTLAFLSLEPGGDVSNPVSVPFLP